MPDSRYFALFELGFRPFFLAAGIFAVVSMLLWMLMYQFSVSLPVGGSLSPVTWHAHEMIYGYAMAVIAGFLLTAVSNWTGIRTWHGAPLVTLLACWVVARLAWILPLANSLPLAATADLLFMGGLMVGVSLPVIRVRQWKQQWPVLRRCVGFPETGHSLGSVCGAIPGAGVDFCHGPTGAAVFHRAWCRRGFHPSQSVVARYGQSDAVSGLGHPRCVHATANAGCLAFPGTRGGARRASV